MNDPANSFAEALAVIITPIVKEAVREAMGLHDQAVKQSAASGRAFLTVKQAAELTGLGASTIRLHLRKRQLPAQHVGRRVIIKREDLEQFLEANPICALPE